jgi:hypothetical protein
VFQPANGLDRFVYSRHVQGDVVRLRIEDNRQALRLDPDATADGKQVLDDEGTAGISKAADAGSEFADNAVR